MTETNTLNAAMAKFQEGYKPPVRNNKVDFKTAKGQRIKYDYADLRALQDAIRHTGSPLGIGFRTSFEQFEQFNSLWLKAVVTITHAEREVKVDGIPLFVASSSTRMPDAQASGSLRTYAERYALQSAFGIASDSDDDGAIAKDKYQNQQKQQSEQPQQVSKSVNQESQPTFTEWVNSSYDELMKLTGWSKEEITVMLEGKAGSSLKGLERSRVVAVIKESIAEIKKSSVVKKVSGGDWID